MLWERTNERIIGVFVPLRHRSFLCLFLFLFGEPTDSVSRANEQCCCHTCIVRQNNGEGERLRVHPSLPNVHVCMHGCTELTRSNRTATLV